MARGLPLLIIRDAWGTGFFIGVRLLASACVHVHGHECKQGLLLDEM